MEVAARMMVFKEARECVEKINTNMSNVRALVLDLYEREGWNALGYKSWRECAVAEFKQGQAYLYYQLEAAQIERNISTIVEKTQIPESQLRPLSKLTPEQQREGWKRSVATAPDGKVTAAHVAKVVREMTEAATHLFLRVHAGEGSGHGVSRFYSRERAYRASGGKRYE